MLHLKRLLKNYESAARSFAELVPCMQFVTHNMIQNKDGGLLVCYRFSGIDQEGVEQSNIDQYAQRLEHAFRQFDERIIVWWTNDHLAHNTFPEAIFPDPISQKIHQRWAKTFTEGALFINDYYLSVLYTPPCGFEKIMDHFNYFSRNEGLPTHTALLNTLKTQLYKHHHFAMLNAQLESMIASFNEILIGFEETLNELKLTRLSHEQLLTYLHRRVSPSNMHQSIKAPKIPVFLDAFLPDHQLTVEHQFLKFQGPATQKYVAAISVKDWPDRTHPNILDDIMAIEGELTINQCFRFTNTEQAKRYIDDIARHNRNSAKPLRAVLLEALTKEPSKLVNAGRLAMAQDAENAALKMTTQQRVYGYHNLTILAYGDTPSACEDTLKAILQVLGQAGYIQIRETLHLLSAWAGTIPGQWAEIIRWHFVSTANLADLSPIRTVDNGTPICQHLTQQTGKTCSATSIFATQHNTPFYFNFFETDVAHTLVIGPTRSGKSVFNNFLLSQFRRYHPCQIFIFDKDYSCRIPTLLHGGSHIDLSRKYTSASLNPLHLVGERHHWEWLLKWLAILLTARGFKLTADHDIVIRSAIENLAELPATQWQLRNLYPFLTKDLGEQLAIWCGDGLWSHYFDHNTEQFFLNDYSCIEVGGLLDNPHVCTAFFDYAFYRIQCALSGQPTAIYIEEAWYLLREPRLIYKIDEWLRTLAKKNAFVIMATQSLQELTTSPIAATIIDNIPNKVFLPNPNARTHLAVYTDIFGLNSQQVTCIEHARPKEQYYLITPLISRLLTAKFPPEILACLRSDAKAQTLFNRCIDTHTTHWKEKYLEEVIHAT